LIHRWRIFWVAVALAGCGQDMDRQAKLRPLQESAFFPDGQGSRPPVPGTIAQGGLRLDDPLYRGRVGKEFVPTFPFPVGKKDLERGRERYDIFCSPCHDRAGTGRGIVVQRGYRAPSSFHTDRLRQATPGYLFDVITRGFGTMPDYAVEVSPLDRWRIVAYVRALQLSQDAAREDVAAEDLDRLEREAR
jgi:hypothetical protein